MTDSAAAHGHNETPEEIKAHIKGYVTIGGILYVLTVVTVLVAYKQLEPVPAILVALAIATFKASLVALYFMHLIDEKKLIYATLALTVGFFALCMILPVSTTQESVATPTHQDMAEKVMHPHEAAGAGAEGHH